MNREQIIDKFVKDDEYRAICKQVAGHDADDLYQELVLFVLEIPTEKLIKLDETCLRCFFFRMAQKQYNSNNSAFYRKYRKEAKILREHSTDITFQEDSYQTPDVLIEEMMKGIEGLYWYDREILTLYAEKKSMRQVAKETGIPLISIHGTINDARRKVKNKLKNLE